MMIADTDLSDLQEAFAWVDLLSKPGSSDGLSLMVIQRDHVKLRMRPEKNHALPHFHLEYKQEYSASYQIQPLKKLAGSMPKQHEQKLMDWIIKNQVNLLSTWNALKDGKDVKELVIATPKPQPCDPTN